MTAQETADSFIEQAMMQGFDRKTAIQVSAFAVDKIINYTDYDNTIDWMEVMELLEFMK